MHKTELQQEALVCHTHGNVSVLIGNIVIDNRYDCCLSVNEKSGREYLLTDRLEKIRLDRRDKHLHVEFRRNMLSNF